MKKKRAKSGCTNEKRGVCKIRDWGEKEIKISEFLCKLEWCQGSLFFQMPMIMLMHKEACLITNELDVLLPNVFDGYG